MNMDALKPNEGKELKISTKYGDFLRYPVKTMICQLCLKNLCADQFFQTRFAF